MADQTDRTVEVVAYSPGWVEAFDEIQTALSGALGPTALSIEHIGSTSVPGMSSKPTIDVLVVVESVADFLVGLPVVEELGFSHRAGNDLVAKDDHLFLRRVVDGRRTHHLHVVVDGSSEIAEYRLFRDALRSDPEFAEEYEQLKLRLAARYPLDRIRYVSEKSTWVDGVMIRLRTSSSS